MKQFLNAEGTIFIDTILYKYTNINQNLYSLLINHELWFSKPSSFNDPYDCNLNYTLTDIKFEQIYDYLTSANERLVSKLPMNRVKDRARFLFNNPAHLEDLAHSTIIEEISHKGITCLSERDDKLLMWSHYADSHKGVCLTFDVEKDPAFFSLPYKVNYPNTYPKSDPFNNKGDLQFILATKSKDWEYEEEVRIIKDKRNGGDYVGAIKFNPKALIEIKFGYKASREDIGTIKSLVINSNLKVKLYTSELKQGEFGLKFNEIQF